MPYKRLLEGLVRALPAAEGALLLDSEGEVVVEAGPPDLRHRLIGAYQGIALAALRRLLARYGGDAVRSMACRYDGGTVLLRPLKDGYYVVVALAPDAVSAEALWRTERLCDRMNEEI